MRKPDVDLAALRAFVARVYGRRQVDIVRTNSGTSTQVYCLQTAAAIHYLRVAEAEPDRFGAELLVHERLLSLGVRVPAIVHYDPFDQALNRSILITTAITGHPLAGVENPDVRSGALRDAGRDLALINSIPVDGFGFVTRSDPHPSDLSADFPNARTFIERDLDSDLTALESELSRSTCDSVRRAMQSRTSHLLGLTDRLAHGDFDSSHIYVDEVGYTGIIDFGEIRGADPLYDLGHFAVIAGASLPGSGLDPLLEGYSVVTPLSAEDRQRMWFWSALIGVRFLARTRGRTPVALRDHIADRIDHALREQERS